MTPLLLLFSLLKQICEFNNLSLEDTVFILMTSVVTSSFLTEEDHLLLQLLDKHFFAG